MVGQACEGSGGGLACGPALKGKDGVLWEGRLPEVVRAVNHRSGSPDCVTGTTPVMVELHYTQHLVSKCPRNSGNLRCKQQNVPNL